MSNDIITVSNSELDRLSLQEQTQATLFSFLTVYVEKLTKDDFLESLVENELGDRINNKETRISDRVLLDLYKILKEAKSSQIASLLGMIKETQKVVVENNINTPTSNRNYDLTKEEVSKAKEVVAIVEELTSILENEKSEEELESDK